MKAFERHERMVSTRHGTFRIRSRKLTYDWEPLKIGSPLVLLLLGGVLFIGLFIVGFGWLRSRLPHNDDETPTITDAN